MKVAGLHTLETFAVLRTLACVIQITVAEAGGAKRQVVTPQAHFVFKSAAQSILGVLPFHTGLAVAVAQVGSVAQARPGMQVAQAAATHLSYRLQTASMATLTLHHPHTLVV